MLLEYKKKFMLNGMAVTMPNSKSGLKTLISFYMLHFGLHANTPYVWYRFYDFSAIEKIVIKRRSAFK